MVLKIFLRHLERIATLVEHSTSRATAIGAAVMYPRFTLGEMLVMRGNLSEQERLIYEGYLSHKWEFPINSQIFIPINPMARLLSMVTHGTQQPHSQNCIGRTKVI